MLLLTSLLLFLIVILKRLVILFIYSLILVRDYLRALLTALSLFLNLF